MAVTLAHGRRRHLSMWDNPGITRSTSVGERRYMVVTLKPGTLQAANNESDVLISTSDQYATTRTQH